MQRGSADLLGTGAGAEPHCPPGWSHGMRYRSGTRGTPIPRSPGCTQPRRTHARPHRHLLLAGEVQLRRHALPQRRGPDPLPTPRVLNGHLPTAVGTRGGQDGVPGGPHTRAPPRPLPPSPRGSLCQLYLSSNLAQALPFARTCNQSDTFGGGRPGLTRTRRTLSPTVPNCCGETHDTHPAAPSHLLPPQHRGLAAWLCHGRYRRDPATTPQPPSAPATPLTASRLLQHPGYHGGGAGTGRGFPQSEARRHTSCSG